MLPEIRIFLYISFIVSLLILSSLEYYLYALGIVSLLLLRVPFKRVKSGWIPISIFLLFTFISNVINQHGRIVFSIGSLLITYEGLYMAVVRTVRILIMILSAKVFMAATETEKIINGLRNILMPFERFGIPVHDFFHIMGLTIKCFPVLKTMVSEHYRNNIKPSQHIGILEKTKAIALFLLPMFVKSIREPEAFFENAGTNEK